jgi:hypothetical protein
VIVRIGANVDAGRGSEDGSATVLGTRLCDKQLLKAPMVNQGLQLVVEVIVRR